MKEESKGVLRRVNEGEEVLTMVVHLSEVNNFLKRAMSPSSLQNLMIELYSLDNLEIVGVTPEDYLSAASMISETGLDANDCLALKIMEDRGLKEIYSFDTSFERFVRRLPEWRS